jgi:hypothetical protein
VMDHIEGEDLAHCRAAAFRARRVEGR